MSHYKTQPRDSKGRFTILVCVNAHDRCMETDTGPCPYCASLKPSKPST